MYILANYIKLYIYINIHEAYTLCINTYYKLYVCIYKSYTYTGIQYQSAYFAFTLAFYYWTSLEALPIFQMERQIFQRGVQQLQQLQQLQQYKQYRVYNAHLALISVPLPVLILAQHQKLTKIRAFVKFRTVDFWRDFISF